MKHLFPTEKQALIAEAAKRFGNAQHIAPPKFVKANRNDANIFLQGLFPAQKNFVLDPSKRKAALCTRRAGKTTAFLYLILKTAREYPKELIPYVALSRDAAKRLMWHQLKLANEAYNLGYSFHETELVAYNTTGKAANIWLLGASHSDDIDKMRGSRYPLACVDESASFGPHIEDLLVEVVSPALLDLDGTLAIGGSPGRIPAGFFYEITQGIRTGWSLHSWSLLDNPHLPDDARNLARIRQMEGLTEDDPRYIREYLGQWVHDATTSVYKFSPHRNTFNQLPEYTEWYYILGIDFGYDPDPTAFSVGAFSPNSTEFFVLETFAAHKMLTNDIYNKIQELIGRYGMFSAMVGDAAGKQFFSELNTRYGLSIKAADKRAKFDFIEHMNSDYLTGRIKVREGDLLAEEYQQLVRNADGTGEHPKRANHRADATLYAWKESRHWAGHIQPEEPKEGSEEFESRLIQRYISNAEAQAKATQAFFDWDDPWL